MYFAHHHVIDAEFLVQVKVVDLDDVGVSEGGDNAGLALEPVDKPALFGEERMQHFDGRGAVEVDGSARYTSAMPPCPRWRTIWYFPSVLPIRKYAVFTQNSARQRISRRAVPTPGRSPFTKLTRGSQFYLEGAKYGGKLIPTFLRAPQKGRDRLHSAPPECGRPLRLRRLLPPGRCG